jgi:serine/threonine-protein kinase
MSPEQCRGIAESVDHRADIYALSVILHQMLAGRAPFVGAGTGDVLIMHVSADPPSVAQDNPAVPRFVETAILRGLAKLRENRFQSMTEFAVALQGTGARAPGDRPPADPTLQIPAGFPEAAPDRLRATESMATVATPLSWTASGPTSSTRKLSRRAMGVGLAVALAVPLLIFVAADGIRWAARPQPAIAPARVEAGGLSSGAPQPAPVPPVVPPPVQTPAVAPAHTTAPDRSTPPPVTRKVARRSKTPAAATKAPAAPAPPPRRAKPRV